MSKKHKHKTDEEILDDILTTLCFTLGFAFGLISGSIIIAFVQ